MMQRDKIIIRKMCENDTETIAEIEKECFSEPWSHKTIVNELTNPNAVVLVAASGQNVVGYINSHICIDEADINNIAVTENYRKRGIGDALISHLLGEIDVNSVYLEVRESNLGAIKLYNKFGFKQVGTRKNFYIKPTENAILMTKKVTE